MGMSEWRFLLDENVSRRVEKELDGRGYNVEHVVDALGAGVDDLPDILPYAKQDDRVIVTKDYSDFGALDPWDHRGLILIADHGHPPHRVADAIEKFVSAYGSHEEFTGQTEYLDEWFTEK